MAIHAVTILTACVAFTDARRVQSRTREELSDSIAQLEIETPWVAAPLARILAAIDPAAFSMPARAAVSANHLGAWRRHANAGMAERAMPATSFADYMAKRSGSKGPAPAAAPSAAPAASAQLPPSSGGSVFDRFIANRGGDGHVATYNPAATKAVRVADMTQPKSFSASAQHSQPVTFAGAYAPAATKPVRVADLTHERPQPPSLADIYQPAGTQTNRVSDLTKETPKIPSTKSAYKQTGAKEVPVADLQHDRPQPPSMSSIYDAAASTPASWDPTVTGGVPRQTSVFDQFVAKKNKGVAGLAGIYSVAKGDLSGAEPPSMSRRASARRSPPRKAAPEPAPAPAPARASRRARAPEPAPDVQEPPRRSRHSRQEDNESFPRSANYLKKDTSNLGGFNTPPPMAKTPEGEIDISNHPSAVKELNSFAAFKKGGRR